MKSRIPVISFMLLLFCVAANSPAQQRWSSSSLRGEDLIIKLATIRPGKEVYAWWGHAGIIVEHAPSGASYFYDYGRFSFEQDHFYTNFIRGRLFFEVGMAKTSSYLNYYSEMDRSIRIQTLYMSPDRRLALARALDRNVLPENRVYLYDHYYDNCATRLRDLINEFGDSAFEASERLGAGLSFRDITRRYTYKNFPIDFILMYLMGGNIDVEMSVWETMFLPDELEAVTAGTHGLVMDSIAYYTASNQRPLPSKAPSLELPSFLLALAFGLVILVTSLLAARGKGMSFLFLGLLTILIGFLAGLLGTLLGYMSFFSDHAVTYGNENLIFTNPLSFLLSVAGILIVCRKALAQPFLFYSSGAFLIVTLGLGVLKLFIQPLHQENMSAMVFFGTLYAFLFAASLVMKKRSLTKVP